MSVQNPTGLRLEQENKWRYITLAGAKGDKSGGC